MEKDGREAAGKAAFNEQFEDQEKVGEAVEAAFEQIAPTEFAAEKAAELAASSGELAEGGERIREAAEKRGGEMNAEETAEEVSIESSGEEVAQQGAAKLEAAAAGAAKETPPPLPSKAEREQRKDDKELGALMAAELAKIAGQESAPKSAPSRLDKLVEAEAAIAAKETAAKETAPPSLAELAAAEGKDEGEVAPEGAIDMEAFKGRLAKAGIEGAQMERMMKIAEKNPEAALKGARALEVKSGRERVATLEAKLKKFEGLGKIRMLSGSAREEHAKLLKELEVATKEYSENRAEFVGENVRKMLVERMKIADERLDRLSKERDTLGKIYDAYKGLGEKNLYNTFKGTRLEPKGRIGKMVMRAMSVRTVISVGLLGASAFAASPVLAAVPLVARRAFSGLGTGIGSYDLMKMVADRKREPSPEKIASMSKEQLAEELEAAEARAMTGGKALKGNESYKAMREAFREKVEGTMTEKGLQEKMAETDKRLEELKKKRERNDKIMKGVAAGIGIAVGGFMVSKDMSKLTEAHGAGTVPEAMPGSAEASLSPDGSVVSEYTPEQHYGAAVWENSVVQKGDGVSHVLMRQLEAGAKLDPAKYGFDAAKDGDMHRWAQKMAGKLVREGGYYGKHFNKAINFDEGNPGRVLLVGDAKTGMSIHTLGVETKLVPRIEKIAHVAEAGKLSKDVIPGVGEITKDVPGAVDHAMGQLEGGPHADLAMLDTEQGRAALKEMAKEYVTKPEYGKFYSFDQLAMAKDWQTSIEKGLGHALSPAEQNDLRIQLSGIINKDLRPGETMMLTDMQNNPILGPDGAPMVLRQDYDGRRAAQWLYEKYLGGQLEVPKDVAERLAAEKAQLAAEQVVGAGAQDAAEHVGGAVGAGVKESVKQTVAETVPEIRGVSAGAIENVRATLASNPDLKDAIASLSDEQVAHAMELSKQAGRLGTMNQALLGESWAARGVNVEELKELASKGAVAGGMDHFGNGVSYATGYDAKMAARFALERLGVTPPPIAVEEAAMRATEAAAKATTEQALTQLSETGVAEVSKDLASRAFGSVSGDQMKLGMSWLERGVNADELRALAEKGAVAGGIEKFSGGVQYATGYDAKRAAQYALRKLAERANDQEI